MSTFRFSGPRWCCAAAVAWCASTFAQDVRVVTRPADATVSVTVTHEALADVPDTPDATVVIRKEPPPLREEVIKVETKPAEDAVWIPGYWRWNAATSDYEWVAGVWRRTIPDYDWHAGKYEKVGDGWVWVPGYWGPKESTTRVIMTDPPADLREEVKPDAPGPDYVWISGYWDAEGGTYVWRPGRWERPSQPELTWIPAQWVRTANGYHYIPGRWDYESTEVRTYVITEQ